MSKKSKPQSKRSRYRALSWFTVKSAHKFSGHKTEFEKINYIGYKIIQVKNLKKIYVIHTCSIVF